MHINEPDSFGHSTQLQLTDREREALAKILSHSTQPGLPARIHEADDRAALAKQHYDLRRRRDRFLSPGLFGEPAWDMLLILYWAQKAQQRMTVTSVTCSAAVPATTAHRHIDNLCRDGIVTRQRHPTDGRVSWLSLADAVVEKMDAYFDWMLSAGERDCGYR